MKKYFKFAIGGLLAGIFNGMFGAGGGILIVPILKSLKIEQKKAHATSILIVAILSSFSLVGYILKGYIYFENVLIYIFAGLVGTFVGGFLIKKIDVKFLKKIFGVIILISSIRIFLK